MREIEAIQLHLSSLERRMAQMRVEGTVAAVKWQDGRQWLKVAIAPVDGGTGDVVTDWIEKQQIAMGRLKIDHAIGVGEQVMVDNTGGGGEFSPLSRVHGSGVSDANASPALESDGLHITFGAMRVQLGEDGLRFEHGGTSILMTASEVRIEGALRVTGAALTHNGVNVGDDHRHSGVVPGGGTTGTPV